MLPSSRTPEGEPVRCSTCGTTSRVDISRPPGDSVCPSCGAIVWAQGVPSGSANTKDAILGFIADLKRRVAAHDYSEATCRFLVAGLRTSLGAHGAILWTKRKDLWRFLRPKPILKYSVGRTDSPTFAAEVLAKGFGIQCKANVDGHPCLLLGVPLIYSGNIVGAIEIVQRDVDSDVLRHGYMKFISDVAAIASPLAT